MRTFGLVGKSLSHSYSQHYFAIKFRQKSIQDAEYLLFSLDNMNEVAEFLKNPSLLGFNVTIPYKTEIIPFLDKLDVVAQEVSAVNCVVKQDGLWVGYNTDVQGFEQILQKAEGRIVSDLSVRRKALVLGTGGASKAVCYVLKQKQIPYQLVSRKKTAETIIYNEITKKTMNHYPLIINTTPLGMFPNVNEKPLLPYSALNHNHTLIDLIYNPEETQFLKEGQERGALTINGMQMFEMQAEESWKLLMI